MALIVSISLNTSPQSFVTLRQEKDSLKVEVRHDLRKGPGWNDWKTTILSEDASLKFVKDPKTKGTLPACPTTEAGDQYDWSPDLVSKYLTTLLRNAKVMSEEALNKASTRIKDSLTKQIPDVPKEGYRNHY